MNHLSANIKNGTLALALSAGLVGTAIAQTPQALQPEAFRVNLNWSFPRADDNWDGGLGLTAQAIFPAPFMPEHLASSYNWALSLGTSSWDVNDDTTSGISGNTARLTGDARSVNLGASFLRSDSLSNGLEISSEVGVIFSSVSSDVRLTYTAASALDRDVELDNAFLGLLAVDAKYKANEDITVFGGIGYQFDISSGDATIPTDSEDNKLNAFFIRGGVHF